MNYLWLVFRSPDLCVDRNLTLDLPHARDMGTGPELLNKTDCSYPYLDSTPNWLATARLSRELVKRESVATLATVYPADFRDGGLASELLVPDDSITSRM